MSVPQKSDSVAVFGLGRSGLALLSHFEREGIRAVAYDSNPSAKAALAAAGLSHIPFYSGEDYRLMPKADILYRSPALRPDHPALADGLRRGALLSDEISLFCALCPATLLAVTGSDGKSTTASLVAEALRLSGKRVFLGGNIGVSLLPYLPDMRAGDFAVLELSSFQLTTATLSAEGGVITNLSENHLNWHKDMVEYAAAKERLFGLCRHMTVKAGVFPQREALRFSLDGDTPLRLEGKTLYDGDSPLFEEGDMRLRGRFHMENFLAAAGVTRAFVPRRLFLPLARGFSGLPHRLEPVATRQGVAFYNSSIDTSPMRTLATLSALSERGERAVVLLGGADKGLSLAPLAEGLPSLVEGAVLFGQSREALARALRGRLPLALAESLKDAIPLALSLAEGRAEAVVLSPAFTAFDAFRDYAERGEVFKRAVLALPE
ncbi:MAG: UDP-N-acetylmuramoyl-L-alanine--D-glutamate ligase [Clostridia bacterium]|nr:UDP-N-acetylmuramoyl-L-alanine--D-glutamate ligase [Clostridia bacterium]